MNLKLVSIPAKFLLGPLYLPRPIVDVPWTIITTPNSVFMVIFPPVTHLAYPTSHPPPNKHTLYSYADLYNISAYVKNHLKMPEIQPAANYRVRHVIKRT